MSFPEHFLADFRGSILLLLDAADCECSLAVLRATLAHATPHDPAMDVLKREVNWLAERGLVSPRKIDKVIDAVVITEAGNDVAHGRKSLGGVSIGSPAGD